jgi:prepilin-type processing-associated H-X9-DG protein
VRPKSLPTRLLRYRPLHPCLSVSIRVLTALFRLRANRRCDGLLGLDHGATEAPSLSGSVGPPVGESAVTGPAEMMALGDGFRGGGGVIQDGVSFLWRTSRPEDYSGSTKRSYSRHQGKANVVFCDGHIEALSLEALFIDSSEAALQRWNRDHQANRERMAP